MKRVNHFLPEPLVNALKALAKKLDVSVAELIRRAVEEWLKKKQAD